MSLPLVLTLIIVVPLVSAAILTLGSRRLLRGRPALLTNEGGSPALRAITACYSLTLAFVLASALSTFLSARQQTVNEADTVVALGNLAPQLRPLAAAVVLRELSCYADTVANKEFVQQKAGLDVPDDNQPLERLYRSLPNLNKAGQGTVSFTEAMLAQLAALTSARDSRIRAARNSLPVLLWLVVIGGAVVFGLAVAAVTVVERPWAQFCVLTGGAAIVIGVIVLIASLERPFTGQLSISEKPMRSALTAVSQSVQKPYCVAAPLTG